MIGAEYFHRSLDIMSDKTIIGLFKIIGNLYIVGTGLIFVLYIIASLLGVLYLPLIGVIFLVLASLIQIIAFALLFENTKIDIN